MSPKVPSVILNNGMEMPILGLGTSSPWSKDRDKTAQAVYEAIKMGYRHIDTAWIYEVEDKVGEGIKKALDEGIVQREDLFVVTKVWMTNMKRDRLLAQTKESLKNLGLSYVDCLLVHWPTALKDNGKGQRYPTDDDGKLLGEDPEVDIHLETWPAMEEVLSMGLTKSIGVSNFNSRQIQELMKTAKVAPVTNQVECTPFFPQHKLLKVCREFGITVTAYSPFGGPPEPREDPGAKDNPVRRSLWENEQLQKMAQDHGRSVGHILLKFQVQRGVIVIPKSVSPDRMSANMDIFDFDLSPEDMSILGSLANGQRSVDPVPLRSFSNYPLAEE